MPHLVIWLLLMHILSHIHYMLEQTLCQHYQRDWYEDPYKDLSGVFCARHNSVQIHFYHCALLPSRMNDLMQGLSQSLCKMLAFSRVIFIFQFWFVFYCFSFSQFTVQKLLRDSVVLHPDHILATGAEVPRLSWKTSRISMSLCTFATGYNWETWDGDS